MAADRRLFRPVAAAAVVLIATALGCCAEDSADAGECTAAGCLEAAAEAAVEEAGIHLLQMQTQMQTERLPLPLAGPSMPVEVLLANSSENVSVSSGDALQAAELSPLPKVASETVSNTSSSSLTAQTREEPPSPGSLKRRYRRGSQQAFTQLHLGAVTLVLSLFAVQLLWVQYCSKKKRQHIFAEREKARSAPQPLSASCADVLATEKASAMTDRELRLVFKDAPCCCLNEWRKYRSQWRMAGQKEEARLHGRVMLLLHGPTWNARAATCVQDDCPSRKATSSDADKAAVI